MANTKENRSRHANIKERRKRFRRSSSSSRESYKRRDYKRHRPSSISSSPP
jgi:hypothetical protein